MERERIDEAVKNPPAAPVVEEKLRTPVTILFSDIKGSTAYFEENGDVEGLAMVERHNNLLFPCVAGHSGRVVKTIGDAIMALFDDPVNAVKAAVRMQLALDEDNQGRPDFEQVHIRIGIHTGLGLIQGNDVFGDVVNAAARVQAEAQPDQILVADSLFSAASAAGYQIARLGRAQMKGKGEPIDVYAVGWSPRATQQLIHDLEERFNDQLQQLADSQARREEDFDRARAEWADERRRLNQEFERLEESVQVARELARQQVGGELQKQLEFKIETADTARLQVEEDLKRAQERFDAERASYKTEIADLEKRLLESMEQVNSPARTANLVREEVVKRLAEAKREWQAQRDAEQMRWTELAEAGKNLSPQDRLARARRMVQERIKAKHGGTEPGQSGEDLESAEDLQSAKERLERERDELRSKVQMMEKEAQRTDQTLRSEIASELRHTYDQKLELASRARSQLELEVRTLSEELEAERQSAATRIQQLTATIPAAEEAARTQAIAEVRADGEAKLEEADRVVSRLERRHRESVDEWKLERARLEKQLRELESNLKLAREGALRRSSDPTMEELNRIRRQLENEYKTKAAIWELEQRQLIEKIQSLEKTSNKKS